MAKPKSRKPLSHIHVLRGPATCMSARPAVELLGLWIQQTEGAKFWLAILSELKNRGVDDILIACVDGLKGFAEAIETVFPQTTVQLCIVHMVRNSMRFVSWKDRKVLARDLKQVYRAGSEKQALAKIMYLALKNVAEKWNRPLQNWGGVVNQLMIIFEERMVVG